MGGECTLGVKIQIKELLRNYNGLELFFQIEQYIYNNNITFMFFLVMILALNFGENFYRFFFFLFLSPEPLSSERSVQILFQYCITKQALNDIE